MSKIALNSMPGGRRVAHVVLASMLIAAAGTSTAFAGGKDDGKNRAPSSGMTRMQQMGGHQQAAPAPAPRSAPSAPAPRSMPSAPAPHMAPPQQMMMPRQAPMPQAPMPQAPPRVITAPNAPGAPIMRMRAPEPLPQVRTFSQPQAQSVGPATPPRIVIPPSLPQVVQGNQGNAPINRMRAPQDRAPSPPPQAKQSAQSSPPSAMPRVAPPPKATQVVGNAPINRLGQPARRPDPPLVGSPRTDVLASPSSPAVKFGSGAGRGNVANITTNPKSPGAPIMKLRAPALHESSVPAAPTVPGVSHLANPQLSVDARVAAASGHWHDGHGGFGHGFHGDHDGFGHHDHFHSSFVFSTGFVFAPTLPWCGSRWGWGWGSGWGCSNFSVGFAFGDPWCYSYPSYSYYPSYYPRYSGYYSSCYNPIGYSLEYPTYAYAYPVYPTYAYDTSPLYADYSVGTDYHSYSTQGQVYTTDGNMPSPAVARPAIPAGDDAVTVYRTTRDKGPMAWSDTATSIINALVIAPADQRHATAKQFLGRTPVGAWEATFEGRQDFDGVTELTCRGTAVTATGGKPTIVVRVNRTLGAIEPGQRLSVTGRLTEVSVDDSSNPGGLLVLEDADVSW
jgi:hypothetical protein